MFGINIFFIILGLMLIYIFNVFNKEFIKINKKLDLILNNKSK